MKEKNYSYIDLFAGCGGLSLGLYNAGWKGLFAIEKSPDAFKTLKHNLIDKKNHFEWVPWLPQTNLEIDIVIKHYKSELQQLRGTVDLVAGGPPCQGFSSAGRRRENDQRNNLVKSYIKFIRLVQPKIIFFENVKGFTLEFKKNKDKGKQYSSYVINALKREGYQVKGQLVNFDEFGIPQKRTRFILIGVKKEFCVNSSVAKNFFEQLTDQSVDFLLSKNIILKSTLGDAISDLLRENGTVPCPDENSRRFYSGLYSTAETGYQIYMRDGSTNSFADSHRFANHNEEIISKFTFIINNSQKSKSISKSIRKKYQIKKHSIIPLDKNTQSPTITTLPDDYIHYQEPRILTVREYARIQSFPDWFEFKGKYTTGGKLRTIEVPRYTQIGNAIPPLFGEQSGLILKKLLR